MADEKGQLVRGCPLCGSRIIYRDQATFRRAELKASKCMACCHQRLPDLTDKIRSAYDKGFTNREIAAVVGCSHCTVASRLRTLGLVSHLARGVPAERVDEAHARCSRCGNVQLNSQFPLVRGGTDSSRLSICRGCRAADARRAAGATPEAYFNAKHRRMMAGERGRRPNRQKIAYELPEGYLVALWHWQQGLCFYIDKPMKISLGAGRDPLGVSIDRIDPHGGYAIGNVVLCHSRINGVKSDLTLDELAEWIPLWFDRISARMPELLASVRPVADDWSRNAKGHRLPAWIVERRRRLEVLRAE